LKNQKNREKKMKKLLTSVLLLCALVSTVFAEDVKTQPYQTVKLGAEVDYTIAAMDQVNVQLNNNGSSVTKLGPAVALAVSLDVAPAPFIMGGARLGYIYCMPASATYLFGTVKETLNASLIPAEIGVSSNFEMLSTPITIMAGIYGGYGFASASSKFDYDIAGISASSTQNYDGAGFVGEMIASINYKMSSGISLNLNGGYRLAKITQMKQSADSTYTDSLGIQHTAGAKGDVLKDSDNNDLAFDFSGFKVGVGASFGF
jgi:hypothetical protein